MDNKSDDGSIKNNKQNGINVQGEICGENLQDILRKAVQNDAYFKKLFYSPSETLKDSKIAEEDKTLLIDLMNRSSNQRKARDKVDQVFETGLYTFSDMRWMNWITFVVGLGLIGIAISLVFIGSNEIYVVLFGGGGIVTLVLQLLVGPLKNAPLALSTFLQSHIIFDSYNHQVGIWTEYQRDARETTKKPIELYEALSADAAFNDFREKSVELLQKMDISKHTETQPAPVKKD